MCHHCVHSILKGKQWSQNLKNKHILFRQKCEIRDYRTRVYINYYSDVVRPSKPESLACSILNPLWNMGCIDVCPLELLIMHHWLRIQIEIWLHHKKAMCMWYACCIYTALMLFWWGPTPHSRGVCILTRACTRRHSRSHGAENVTSGATGCHWCPSRSPQQGDSINTHSGAQQMFIQTHDVPISMWIGKRRESLRSAYIKRHSVLLRLFVMLIMLLNDTQMQSPGLCFVCALFCL